MTLERLAPIARERGSSVHQILRPQVFATTAAPVAARWVHPVIAGRPHGHDFIEVAVVTGGSATHVSAAGRQRISIGSVVVVRPGEWHGYDECRDLGVHNLFIGAELFRREVAWIREDPQLRLVLWPSTRRGDAGRGRIARVEEPNVERLTSWLREIEVPPRGHARERTSLLAHLTLVLGEIAPAFNAWTPLAKAPTHPMVLRAAQLLESRFDEPWSLPALADEVRLARAYLVRLFGRDIGVPPMTYLARLRAERMAALLIETDEPVAVIGREVGWHDPNYASRRFRAFFGRSPLQYRAQFQPRSG